MEKLTYTHNAAAAKVLAAFYETPPLAYVRSYGCHRYANQHFPNESELMQWPFRGQYYLILSIGAAGRSEVQIGRAHV